MSRGFTSALFTVILALLLLGFGLAVPSISVNVQGIGVGGCNVKSPVLWARITLTWDKSGPAFYQTWTLSGVSVVFSDDVSGGFNITVFIKIYGYNRNKNSLSTDIVKGTLSTTSGISSGIQYSLVLNDTPQYIVSSFFGYPPPEVLNASAVAVGGSTSCVNSITVSSEGVGMGSTSYSPPPLTVPQINITINNTGNPQLKDYVVNFTVSPSCVPNLSRVYVTDSSGNPLYFWAFNDSTNGKIWFWVNYTVPANSVVNITIHLNGTSQSSYFEPERVFWYFNATTLSLSGGFFSGNIHVINYPLSNFNSGGYNGYAADTNATLAASSIFTSWLGPYFLSFRYGRYYVGIGATGDASLYVVYGNSPSGVNNAGDSLGSLPSWGPGIYSVVNYLSSSSYYTDLSFEGDRFFRGEWPSGTSLMEYFVLGQRYGGPSVYDWIGLRPVWYPFPRIRVPSTCVAPGGGGDYTFTIYFRP